MGVDDILDGRHFPADYWATVDEADRLWRSGDTTTFVQFGGRNLPGGAERRRESFSTKGPWIASSHGYRVRALGRAGMEYQDAAQSLHINSEALATRAFVIWPDSIPERIRPEVIENIIRAWLWSGFDIQLPPVD